MTKVTFDIQEIVIHRSFDYSDNKYYSSLQLIPVGDKLSTITITDVKGSIKDYCNDRFPGIPYRTIDHTRSVY